MKIKFIIFAGLLGVTAQAAPPDYKIIDLGTLDGRHSEANALNDHRQVVGTAYYDSGPWRAFLYEDGNQKQIPMPGPLAPSVASDINNKGQVVGNFSLTIASGIPGYDPLYVARPFLYHAGQFENLAYKVPDSDWDDYVAHAININAEVVGAINTLAIDTWGTTGGVIYKDGAAIGNGIPNASGSDRWPSPMDINDQGEWVAEQEFGYPCWLGTAISTAAGILRIDSITLGSGELVCPQYTGAMNNLRQVAGSVYVPSENMDYAVFYSAESILFLDKQWPHASTANGLNDKGDGIGWSWPRNGSRTPFVFLDGVTYLFPEVIDGPHGFESILGLTDINEHGDVVGVGRTHAGENHAFLAIRLEYVFVRAIGDIDGDGAEEIAAIAHHGDVTIKNLSGKVVSRFGFDELSRVIDAELLDDLNGNGAPELALLFAGSGQAAIRDTLTGEKLAAVEFNLDQQPVDLELVPDVTGNAVPELANLSKNLAKAQVRDGATGSFVKTLTFNSQLRPRDLEVYPDINGNGYPELGVLGNVGGKSTSDRLEIRDLLTGWRVRNRYLSKAMKALEQELVGDTSGNGYPDTAVLRASHTDNVKHVVILDVKANKTLGYIGLDRAFDPQKLLTISDINRNGADEVAVYAAKPDDSKQKVQIKDSKTRKFIRALYFDPNFVGIDVDISSDMNGNGAQEVVLLGRRDDNGKVKAIIKDARTGALVGTVPF